MNTLTQLGKRITYLRKQKGLSQLKFSYLCEINTNYISDLERGKRNPSVLLLEKIAKGLEISLSELFKGIDSI